MKRLLLLAAVHALIINQSSKNAKGKPSPVNQKKGSNTESIAKFSAYQLPENPDYASAILFGGMGSVWYNRK